MASISELLNGHVTLEVECLGRLYLNEYIGPLATPGGLAAGDLRLTGTGTVTEDGEKAPALKFPDRRI
jgi:hypothetical protein